MAKKIRIKAQGADRGLIWGTVNGNCPCKDSVEFKQYCSVVNLEWLMGIKESVGYYEAGEIHTTLLMPVPRNFLDAARNVCATICSINKNGRGV